MHLGLNYTLFIRVKIAIIEGKKKNINITGDSKLLCASVSFFI